jgi:hypothetical protein
LYFFQYRTFRSSNPPQNDAAYRSFPGHSFPPGAGNQPPRPYGPQQTQPQNASASSQTVPSTSGIPPVSVSSVSQSHSTSPSVNSSSPSNQNQSSAGPPTNPSLIGSQNNQDYFNRQVSDANFYFKKFL